MDPVFSGICRAPASRSKSALKSVYPAGSPSHHLQALGSALHPAMLGLASEDTRHVCLVLKTHGRVADALRRLGRLRGGLRDQSVGRAHAATRLRLVLAGAADPGGTGAARRLRHAAAQSFDPAQQPGDRPPALPARTDSPGNPPVLHRRRQRSTRGKSLSSIDRASMPVLRLPSSSWPANIPAK